MKTVGWRTGLELEEEVNVASTARWANGREKDGYQGVTLARQKPVKLGEQANDVEKRHGLQSRGVLCRDIALYSITPRDNVFWMNLCDFVMSGLPSPATRPLSLLIYPSQGRVKFL